MNPATREPHLFRRLRDQVGRRGLRTLSGAAALTIVVRAIGLLSQATVLTTLGASAQLDAFLVAFIAPNLITATYAGAVELGTGPVYTRAREAGPELAERVRVAAISRAVRAGVLTTIVLLVLQPVVVSISSAGAGTDVRSLAQDLAWWVFPTVALSFVAASCSVLLLASNRIQVPIAVQAIRPIALAIGVRVGESATAMAVAIAIGALVETLVSLGVVRGLEGPFSVRPHPEGARIEDVHTRGLVVSTAITQAAPAIDSVVAASLGPGKLALYTLASRFYDVGKSAFLQPNARLAQNRLGRAAPDVGRVGEQLKFEVRRALSVGAGAMVLLAIGGPACIFLLFRRDEFTTADARTASALAVILAVSMLPWALASVLPRALVILGRIRMYALLCGGFVVLNLALDLALSAWLGLTGVAAATGTAVAVFVVAQAVVLTRSLRAAPPVLQNE